jgi:uncharacterized protein (UPF0248 family)
MNLDPATPHNYVGRIRSRCTEDENGCWLYQPPQSKQPLANYFHIKYFGKSIPVHRVMWVEMKGPPPEFSDIRHKPVGLLDRETEEIKQFRCPSNCCNPNHLYIYVHRNVAKRFKNTKPPIKHTHLFTMPPAKTNESLRKLLDTVGVKNPKLPDEESN